MFKLNKKGNIAYYTISSFEETGLVKHGFSTREGGVSTGCYASMNLRIGCDDSTENIMKNYSLISQALGMEREKLVKAEQVHEDKVRAVTSADCGNGIVFPDKFGSADALVTNERGVPLVTSHADCVPLFFLDKENAVIALAHSGWRGTIKRIGQKVVMKMKSDYGSKAENILTAIGPSIQLCHFEVGDEVAQEFIREFGENTVKKYGDKYHADMQSAIKMQFAEEGILPENIDDCGICTYCNSDFLFSHRATAGKRGNMCAFLELK